ncbi:hypothetical protein BRE01_49180 [Brevibacillus reuszeri]|uniref:Uncharacterized protein n=1 Tax=Brevibacillus reuszeri TaxID=54915 RepID=A0A0K9YLI2_9BACL|nr:hypothetical protein ADS79_27005 [Brevibacillus reuszeri]GED71216.1 hypothetical protein BRE01_49180 [Brevibacillus reuszeri]
MGRHRPLKPKKRNDLIGQVGTLNHKVTIVDANESFHGVDVQVRDFRGEIFWTSLENVNLDNKKDPAATESRCKT